MSKFSLTVNTDDTNVLAALVALLKGTPTPYGGISIPHTDAQTVGGDEDESESFAPTGDLDSDGLPWDERIHSPNKATVKSGAWRKKKGVSDDLVKQVEAELRARAAGPVAQVNQGGAAPFVPPSNANPGFPSTSAPTAPVPAGGPATMPAPGAMGAAPGPGYTVHTPGQPAPTPAPQFQPQPQVQQPPAQPQGIDFAGLMNGLNRATQQNRCDQQILGWIVTEVNKAWNANYQAITDLISRPDIVNWVKELLVAQNIWVD